MEDEQKRFLELPGLRPAIKNKLAAQLWITAPFLCFSLYHIPYYLLPFKMKFLAGLNIFNLIKAHLNSWDIMHNMKTQWVEILACLITISKVPFKYK